MTSSTSDYQLHTLGWKAFQDLCIAVLGKVLSQTVQAFHPTNDAGRDGAFWGNWDKPDLGAVKGTYTVQCKHSSNPKSTLSLSDIAEELTKAKLLAKNGLCTNYVLITNCKVTAVSEGKMRTAFIGIKGIKRFILFGREWINQQISQNADLRLHVPRIYGLGDLTQILDERSYSQAEAILDSMRDDLSKFVITDAYRKSAEALVNYGFVLLLGEPASGKSTIAAGLALGAIDKWGTFTVKVKDATDFKSRWNPKEPRQFFWIDDAFGATQHERHLTDDWNRILPEVAAAIKHGARVIMTSRDYIYKDASKCLKTHAFPLINESNVVIRVEELTLAEKGQILYNHLKLGDQEATFKTEIKPYLQQIVENHHFLPEIARRLGSKIFTKNLPLNSGGVTNFVTNPTPFLVEVIRALDPHLRSTLILMFMTAGCLESPISYTEEIDTWIKNLGFDRNNFTSALYAMDGSLLKYVKSTDGHFWRYKHPTINEAVASIVVDDHELLDVYICGVTPQKLVYEVTCGSVDLEGVKVIIPESRYSQVVKKISSLPPSILYRFLSYRCDLKFIKLFIQVYPEILAEISSPIELSNSPAVDLFCVLHSFDLISEENRITFVKKAQNLSINTPSSEFLNEAIRSCFTEDEVTETLQLLKCELIPRLKQVVTEWTDRYTPADGSPYFYYEDLQLAIGGLKEELFNDDAYWQISEALEEIENQIEYFETKYFSDDDDYDPVTPDEEESNDSERSIFDDVDE